MKYYVNEQCIGCGLCEGICPEVFEITNNGVAKAIDDPVANEIEDKAAEAKESCPVGAIEETE